MTKAAGADALRLSHLTGAGKVSEGRRAPRSLDGLGDVAGADAAGADLDGLDAAIPDGLHLLQVRVPRGAGLVVGVADVVTETGTFAADFTFSRHGSTPSRWFLKLSLIADGSWLCK